MKINSQHLNWGAISAVVALVAIAAYDQIAPPPGSAGVVTSKSKAELEKDKKEAMGKLAESEKTVNALTWQVSRDEVDPTAMAWVSQRARQNFVEVSAFRPQRSVDAEGLDQLNYLVTAEGSYLNVMQFIQELEGQDSHLAIKALQLASINGASDTVRATVALVAYQEDKSSG
jgi:Tfp pilus assembly protein PilO